MMEFLSKLTDRTDSSLPLKPSLDQEVDCLKAKIVKLMRNFKILHDGKDFEEAVRGILEGVNHQIDALLRQTEDQIERMAIKENANLSLDVLMMPLSPDLLDLSPKLLSALELMQIQYLGDLLICSERDLSCLRNIGPISVMRIQKQLAKKNFTLGMAMQKELKKAFYLRRMEISPFYIRGLRDNRLENLQKAVPEWASLISR